MLNIQVTPYEPKLEAVYRALECGILPQAKNSKEFLICCPHFTVIEGKLFLKQKSQLQEILRPDQHKKAPQEAHNSARLFDQQATMARASILYWCPGLYKEVIEHIQQCEACTFYN
ncbi:hypothetical protein DSO57_1033713 [Entomophthora muscae]|uniref:Uncharacterized protein n=1 Tax=Entomophthora muscae TaxID=34485 RepID=A0ACC2SCN7_9FUNG|nr:hypothetical protein DSO57_1033713 [Entomophthora muscae]